MRIRKSENNNSIKKHYHLELKLGSQALELITDNSEKKVKNKNNAIGGMSIKKILQYMSCINIEQTNDKNL
jgi:hypothetical protein